MSALRPRRATAPALLCVAVLALGAGGCVDTRPSSGTCTGTVDGVMVSWAIAPDSSDFHRWDGLLGDEDGPFRMSFGPPGVVIDAELESVPHPSYVGAHTLPADPILHFFRVELPSSSAVFLDGTMTVTTSSSDRFGGQLELRLTAGALSCTFDLRRNYALDTDR